MPTTVASEAVKKLKIRTMTVRRRDALCAGYKVK